MGTDPPGDGLSGARVSDPIITLKPGASPMSESERRYFESPEGKAAIAATAKAWADRIDARVAAEVYGLMPPFALAHGLATRCCVWDGAELVRETPSPHVEHYRCPVCHDAYWWPR